MKKRDPNRFDKMNTKSAFRLARFGVTDKKMIITGENIINTFKNLRYIQCYDTEKVMHMKVHFRGGYFYLKDGEIGFHLDDINHIFFKTICKCADKLKIDLENFKITEDDEFLLSDRHKIVQKAIDIIISEL